MALVKCKECQNLVAKHVKKCPQCGTGKNRSFFRNHPILTIFALLIIIGYLPTLFIDKKQINSNHDISQNIENENDNNKSNLVNPPDEILSNWDYSLKEDKMRNKKIIFAKNQSINPVNLGFPHVDSKMNLTIRKMDNNTNVILDLDGVFVCDYGSTCMLNVKSDNSTIFQYEYVEAAHSISDTVFIKDSEEFIKMLKSSKHLIIEAQLYDKGRVQYEFNVADLKWNDNE